MEVRTASMGGLRPAWLGALAGVVLAVQAADATVTFYTGRAAFDAAAPGLPVDRFGATLLYNTYPNDYFFHARPVSAATHDAIFPAGSILPGVTIDCENPLFIAQALKLEPIAGGNQVGAGTFQDTLILDFSPAVSAVGFDILGHVYSHPLYDGNVEVTVYSGAAQLAYRNPQVPGGSAFVGVTSSASNITRVTLLFNPTNGESDTCTFIANLAFGSPGAHCVADVDNGSGTGTPDGGVTVDDLLFYLGLFAAGDIRADIDDGSGTNHPDGGVTIDDLLYYLVRFNAGC